MIAKATKIADGVYWVGVLDWNSRTFHGYGIPGTTYNTYLVFGEEKTVLIDDFDKTCVKLSYYLKIWGDNYRFNGEIKGSIIQPIYNKLIITSNYNIEELFYDEEKPDIELVNALKRRFKEIHMLEQKEQDYIINIINS